MRRPLGTLLWLVPAAAIATYVALLVVDDSRHDHATRHASRGHVVRIDGNGYPLTIVDSDDSTQRVEKRPERIVLASAAVVDLATALIGPDRVRSLAEQAFTWSVLALDPGAWTETKTFRAYLTELVLAEAPDLVICSTHSNSTTTDSLRDAGVVVVELPHPKTLQEAQSQLWILARLLDATGEATAVARGVERRVDALRARSEAIRTDGAEPLRVMFYENGGTGGWTDGADTLTDTAIELAGFANAAALAGRTGASPITFEQLLAIDPDVLVVGKIDGKPCTTEQLLRTEPALAGLAAVRNDRIVGLHPAYYSTGSHQIVAAAEALVDALAPPPPPEDGR